MSDRFRTGPSFRVHAPCHPYGTDPSRVAGGQPAVTRQNATIQWITRGNGSGVVGRMTGAPAPAQATITCTDANVVQGDHIIRIGPHELRPFIDFAIGAGDNALATALAAAITTFPEFTAGAVGNVVTISTAAGHGDDHRMEVVERAAAAAFVLGALEKAGFLDRGAPTVAGPTIS